MDAYNKLAYEIDGMMIVSYVLQSFTTKENGKLFSINVSRQYVTLKVAIQHHIDHVVRDSIFICSSRSKFHHFCCRTIVHNDQEYREYRVCTATEGSV